MSGTRMGDLFNQRRAAAKRDSPQKTSPPSLVEIQAEQEKSTKPRETSRQSSRSFRAEEQERSNQPRRQDSRSFRNDRRGQRPDRSDLPLEQGSISSLKEAFGFIYCADRPNELFFHYSELAGYHSSDLNVNDEVEFRVGPSRNDDKMAAFEVKRLEPGTIDWEVEEEPVTRHQGLVQRPVRSERGSSQVAEGTIRMLVPDEEAEDNVTAAATGPLIRYTASDYVPEQAESSKREFRRFDSTTSNSSRGGRLGMNDLVEFALVTERRTGNKFARSITLLQSAWERHRLAREKELLANATLEQGVVTSLKTDFGFLRSNRRREEVYFHYSNVVLPDDEANGDDEFELKEGQDMEFLVVLDPAGGGGKERFSARKVKFLPKGSVVFYALVAEGVTGVVTRPPHPADAGYSSEMVGRVSLSSSIQAKAEDNTAKVIDEVLFYSVDAPGGSYSANRDGSSVGLWVREGDTLLFDVVKDVVDGSFRVAPTKHLLPIVGGSSSDESEKDKASETSSADVEKAVRLIAPSLAGRAEGVVHAIKDVYGFITCTERPVDAYFRLFEVLPDEIQDDVRRNMGIATAGTLELKLGMQVQFDLSLQGTVATSNPRSRGSRHGSATNERENLKAQRLLLLPPSTIMETKVIAKDAKGIVSKEDTNQSYAGFIEFKEPYKPMSLEERHPLVAKLVNAILEDESPKQRSVVYHDLQSIQEDDVVVNLVEELGKGSLTCSHIPVAGESGHPGRLCIAQTNTFAPDVVDGPSADEDSEKPDDSASSEPTAESADAGAGDKLGQSSHHSLGQISSHSMHGAKRRKRPKAKDIKVVHYDKHCFSKELLEEIPPGNGDVVLCDIVQSRRTGMVELRNIRVIERSEMEVGDDGDEADTKSSGVGIVTEIVAASKFGFISLLDENASRREMLFFQFSSIVNNVLNCDKDSPTSKKRRGGGVIAKGDEVTFDVAVGKQGKRTAININVVPRGTLNIPTKAEKNACHGFVLMDPSQISLSNTPVRQASRTPAKKGNGRWENVSDLSTKIKSSTSAKEEGCILLVRDPTNMFSIRKAQKKETQGAETTPSKSDESDGADKEEPVEEANLQKDSEICNAVGTHIAYKNGAIAIHGAGASSVADGSSILRRGDLVSFMKAKSGKRARDIRVVERGAATLLRGRLENITLSTDPESTSPGTAKFIASTENEEEYDIDLTEVVSCDVSILKDKESVEGILHDNQIFGVCRTSDIYLESKLGSGGHKERPKLNLTVRKELKNLGGKIMAQSMMAKGPDGTNGFALGWTSRVSPYSTFAVENPKDAPKETQQIDAEPASQDSLATVDDPKDRHDDSQGQEMPPSQE